MLTDARSVPTGTVIDTDICIVGGGAAGITLARQFIGSGHKVVLLESGGDTPEDDTQDLYAGSDIGHPYPMFDASRLRYFGGTTNHWGRPWCDLPSPLDFEERHGVPFSGWPFALVDLEPWYRRAQPIFGLGPFGYALADWGIAQADIPAPFQGPHFMCRVLQQGQPLRFGRAYGPELASAPNVTVYLHANALRFDGGENGGPVRQVQVGVIPDGRFTVRARIFVLACGGIENARLLLLSRQDDGTILGNAHDLVGRFFMLHLEYSEGEIVLDDPHADLSFQTGENGALFRRSGKRRRFVSYISLSDDTRRAHDLPAIRLRFQYPRLPEIDVLRRLVFRAERQGRVTRDLATALASAPGLAAYVARRIIHGRNKPPVPLAAVPLHCTAEQMPNPDSRIGLGDDRDRFGLRRVAVDWRLMAEDRHGIAAGRRLLADELASGGFGRLRVTSPDRDDGWPADLRGDQHHMGTTRMHRDPARGVVDENCRLHDTDNLYVAGCSLFPTGGTFNVTLTIVALALRLADHLKQQLQDAG